MLKNIFLTAILFLVVTSVIAQKSINDYKYIIVPVQYEFQKGEDAFQVNSLTKFLFNKAGFKVYLSNEVLPQELNTNRCLALTAKLNDNSKMLSTKMNFDLVDCYNNVVFSSVEGKSKEKEYKKAYHECIRKAFEDIKNQDYAYNSGGDAAKAAAVVQIVDKPEVAETNSNSVAVSNIPVVDKSNKKVAPVVTSAVVVNEVTKPKKIEGQKTESVAVISDVLFAQPNENGFQIVDSTPKVIYVLLKTAVKDVYIVKDHGAIVYKNDDSWKVDYYKNGKLITKDLNLKFF